MAIVVLLLIVGVYGLFRELAGSEPADPSKIAFYTVLGLAGLLGLILIKTNGKQRKRKDDNGRR